MENFFSRYKNPLVLMIILVIQVVGLATQIKRAESGSRSTGSTGGPRLIRVWTVTIITPFERAFSGTGHFFRRTWHNYIDLHDARKENQELHEQIARMKMERVQLQEDAQQAKRLQTLLDFKERYAGQTLAAQVIGTSGTEQSRLIYIDKGSRSGIKQDMPVITPDGIVGKVKEVFPFTAQVLMINDHDSGAGVLMQNLRHQGILKGTPQGQLIVTGVMSDEKMVGEHIVTSGGDRIYPKGLPVGTVISSSPDPDNDPFLRIMLKPAANLDQLEEVLVVTKMAEGTEPAAPGTGPQRAADILAQRLPSAKETPSPTPSPTPAAPSSGEKKTPAAVATPGKAPATTTPVPNAPATGNAIPGASPVPGVTAKKKVAKPKPQPTPAATDPQATPEATPEPKKPDAEAQPTPPPSGVRLWL